MKNQFWVVRGPLHGRPGSPDVTFKTTPKPTLRELSSSGLDHNWALLPPYPLVLATEGYYVLTGKLRLRGTHPQPHSQACLW